MTEQSERAYEDYLAKPSIRNRGIAINSMQHDSSMSDEDIELLRSLIVEQREATKARNAKVKSVGKGIARGTGRVLLGVGAGLLGAFKVLLDVVEKNLEIASKDHR